MIIESFMTFLSKARLAGFYLKPLYENLRHRFNRRGLCNFLHDLLAAIGGDFVAAVVVAVDKIDYRKQIFSLSHEKSQLRSKCCN